MSSKQEILEKWNSLRLADKIGAQLGDDGTQALLLENRIERVRKNSRSVVWRLEVEHGTRTIPLYLKMFVEEHHNNLVEINLYRKAQPLLGEFLPTVYHVEPQASRKHGKHVAWVFMESLRPLKAQFKITPTYYFDHVIPALAKLHAHTYQTHFQKHLDLFSPWFPQYDSDAMFKQREAYTKSSLRNLDLLLKKSKFRPIIKPYYSLVKSILQKGPDTFPELLHSGSSINHGDLHPNNICCNNIREENWKIRYIDWEGAMYGPVWFDLIMMVELQIDWHEEWHCKADELRQRYIKLYVQEMNKLGITFADDPLTLYKKAYLQWVLEKGLYYDLSDAVDGRDDLLLERYFVKIKSWGKEFKLYECEKGSR